MAEVRLRAMSAHEYDTWYNWAVEDYAEAHIASGEWAPEDATDLSRQQFAALLPSGPSTPAHHLFTVADAGTDEAVGVIWFAERRDTGVPQAFIYDIVIWPQHRGMGHGELAMLAIEPEARALGLQRIGLHVFGHNGTAIRLYERTGYKITNLLMAKDLA
jgi:ribosomal protein S18 acetylase RimI-like enzyme